MKKIIMTSALIFSLATALPAWSDEAHHPEAQEGNDTPVVEMIQQKTDSSITKMEESRKKMEAATSPAERKALMHEHMQHMKDGMKMMGMMGGKMMMMGDMDTSKMPMAERMAMMEKRIKMMENMKNQGGMMGGKGMMMGGMMGGSNDNHMKMMENKMKMMMEMMRGMMSQHEMMMK